MSVISRSVFKTRISISALIIFLFLFIASCASHTQSKKSSAALDAVPQKVAVVADPATIPLDSELPVDPKIIIGKLDNGISYYIRKNTEPANRADIRLVINSGSILEGERQRGLAHVLEHMAFQGTEHFEKQAITDFMESIGMQMGSGVNAFTGIDDTTYMLQLPTDNENHLETAFLILRDWATGIKFEPEEIESERKVVIEEWRQGQGAQERINQKTLPVLFKDSLYAERIPIGTLESLQNFTRNDLIRFYRDWYRPDLMAVIAVGDFDISVIENLIHKKFESIPAPENPKERKTYTVPVQENTLFAIVTDPEVQMTQVSVYHKFPYDYDWTVGGHRKRIVEGLYNSMLNERFNEISTKPNPPFMRAVSAKGALIRPLGAYMLQAIVQENGIERGLETLLVESERVARYGFTLEELDRQKTAYMRSLDQMYANRNNLPSSARTAEMTRSFLTGESMPGIEYEVALGRRFIQGITLEEINQIGKNWITNSNRVVIVTAPEKHDLTIPTETDLKNILDSAAKKDIEPYKATIVEGQLIDTIPEGSRVTEKRELEGGVLEWKLANGIKVIIKPTDFREDEIAFTAFGPGGTSLASDEDFIPAGTALTFIANSGLGKFNLMDLRKKLTGKVATVIPIISEYEEGLAGSGSPDDLECLFQQIYLRITAPRSDETIYNIIKTQIRQQWQNRDANPATVFNDTWNRLLYADHSRKQPESLEMLDKMDLAKSFEFYKDRFADTGDFIFIFVGNIDTEKIQPLVETYIGALPSTGRNETWKDVGIRITRKGIIKETVHKGKEPKSNTRIGFNGSFPEVTDLFAQTQMNMAANLLQKRLMDVMRELMGGTYSVQVRPTTVVVPEKEYLISIDFTSAPERVDELTGALFNEIKSLKDSGPKDEELADIKQIFLRGYETGLEQNSYWLGRLTASYRIGINPGAENILKQPEAINAVTVESMRDAFRKYYDFENYIQVTLLPEEQVPSDN